MKQVSVIILGCGGRGNNYAKFAEQYPERMKVTAIAEPRDFQRNRIGDKHNIPEKYRFRDWKEIAKLPKFADAVLVCTQDAMHEEPVIRFAELGYDIMCEKPMAPTREGCERMVEAIRKAGVKFAVGHVLRYTKYTRKIKELVTSGAIGDVTTIQHIESVAHWHQAHSYVRGNWRNEKESSFMLLAKSCHDMDWIRYVMNKPCVAVSSFGNLHYFKPENQPKGAADRCTDCPAEIEGHCPYSSIKIYLRDRVMKGIFGWPTDVLTNDGTVDGVMKALREGPYGRCVYKCDNDVVDHQVVNMTFADGTTAGFTMTAFCDDGRQTHVCGTRGSIQGDGRFIYLTDFVTGEKKKIDTEVANDNGILSGHGGGDGGLMDAFVTAIAENKPEFILTGLDDTLDSHIMTFEAERARREGKVITLKK